MGTSTDVFDGFEVEYLGKARTVLRKPLAAVADHEFEGVEPVRRPAVYRGQRYFPGSYYSVSSQRLVAYESWLERRNLVLLDFDATVIRFATQPFWLHWYADKPRRHAPDVFVRRSDGSGEVIDIRLKDGVKERDALTFDITRQAAAQAGWGYRVMHEPPQPLLDNLEWLAGYRRPVAAFDPCRPAVLDAAGQPVALGRLVDEAGGTAVTRATVFHLLWRQELAADLDHAVLSDDTPVWRTT